MDFSKLLGMLGKGIKTGDEALAVPGLNYKDGSDVTPLKLLDSPMAAARTAISEAQAGNFKNAIPKALDSFTDNPEKAPEYSDILEKTGINKDNSAILGGLIGMIEPSFGGKLKAASNLDKLNDTNKATSKFGKIINIMEGKPMKTDKISYKGGGMMKNYLEEAMKKK